MAAPTPQRVLIIRPSALGDVCRSVPALATLRAALPGARIDWLVREDFADAVRHHPALSGVVPFSRHEFSSGGLGWLRGLSDGRYDLVFDLQGLFRSGLFTWCTRARRRVGHAGAREFAWLGYNVRHKSDAALHTIDRTLALLAAEGYAIRHDTRLYVGPEDEGWLREFMQQNGLTAEPYATLAPTAKWLCKCWPLGSYTEIARRLLKERRAGEKMVVLQGPGDSEYIAPLIATLEKEFPNRVVSPATTVGQMLAILSRTTMLVSNDTAAVHAAVGFDRPIVAIYGPTDPAREGPYRRADAAVEPADVNCAALPRHRHNPRDQSLISRVTVEQVWEKISEQLQRHRPPAPA